MPEILHKATVFHSLSNKASINDTLQLTGRIEEDDTPNNNRGCGNARSILNQQLPRQGHECAPHCFEARCHRFRLIQEPHHSKEDFRNLHEGSVKLLKGLFGHNTSIFVRRYTHLRTQPNSETVCDYFGLVNLLHETADFSAVTLEQMGCFAQICELTATENDIRLLRKIEDDLQMSIEGLSAEIQRESNSSRSYSVNQLSQGNKQTRHFNLFSLWRSQELQLHH